MNNDSIQIEYRDSIKTPIPPGVRIEVRDEEWIVKSCEYDQQIKSYVVKADGFKGVVRGMSATFLSILDKVKIVDPLDFELEIDESPQFMRSKIYLDMWLRRNIPNEDGLIIGHRGAFNEENFQLEPAYFALKKDKHIRPRVLLADAVGMGKTIQAGVLLSELIYRGRGKRILVVCLRSMMTQLQKELWSRFSIPLKAIDSNILQQTYSQIPSNMNPFNFYDKAIVSMDTLKSPRWMKFLDTSYWDVIVIDECHNVARRGKSSSHRSKLARKLSSASDSLILTSATPHDGTKESYASLLELIDPTLVIDPDRITKEDLEISQVVFRRFGKDVKLKIEIPPRVEKPIWIKNDKETDAILLELKDKVFSGLDKNKSRNKDVFFKTTLGKLFFSSPEAAISTIEERLKKISNEVLSEDKKFLEDLKKKISKKSIRETGKYKDLLEILKKDIKKERFVIFTEYRKTQDALVEALAEDLALKISKEEFDEKAEVVSFNATVTEEKQNKIIESFSSEKSKIKILVTTDIASEGVNLHFFCHNLIHFDVPWSFITLEQRNGRIHRYGQKNKSNIYYLVYESNNPQLSKFNEKRVVDKLLERAENVKTQLGDEALALCVFDGDLETEIITQAFQNDESEDIFAQLVKDTDPMYGAVVPKVEEVKFLNGKKVFPIDKFIQYSCKELKIENLSDNGIELIAINDSNRKSMIKMLDHIKDELCLNKATELKLSAQLQKVNESILESRKSSGAWPATHLLWENHPLVEGLHKQLETKFSKNTLPVILWKKEKCFFSDYGYIVFGSIFSKKGRPIKSEILFMFKDKDKVSFISVEDAFKKLSFGESILPNNISEIEKRKILKLDKTIKTSLREIIASLKKKMLSDAMTERNKLDPLLNEKKEDINKWHNDKKLFFKNKMKTPQQKSKLIQELGSIQKVKDKYIDFLNSELEVEIDNPYVRVIGLFVNDGAI